MSFATLDRFEQKVLKLTLPWAISIYELVSVFFDFRDKRESDKLEEGWHSLKTFSKSRAIYWVIELSIPDESTIVRFWD